MNKRDLNMRLEKQQKSWEATPVRNLVTSEKSTINGNQKIRRKTY